MQITFDVEHMRKRATSAYDFAENYATYNPEVLTALIRRLALQFLVLCDEYTSLKDWQDRVFRARKAEVVAAMMKNNKQKGN